MLRLLTVPLLALAVSACGQPDTNAPTEPARPVDTPAADAPQPPPPPGVGSVMPGTGARNFVGRWAADVSWCPNEQGPERPIEITTTRFEGYENSCAISQIDEADGGYVAYLVCAAEGTTSRERVRLAVSGQTLRLTWIDRDAATVILTKCTTLADTTPTGPSLKIN